ncbi:MAG: DMT family transporter [Rhodospirillales bacterium]|jgi:drug/metabolite transporter (DMT)-like permease
MIGNAQSGQDRPALGIILMIFALFVLASMDAVAKHLTETLAAPQILAVRFWIFLTFSSLIASRRGLRQAAHSKNPRLQIVRTLVLVVEMTMFLVAFSFLPLAEVHAIAAVSPLIVMALAAIFLGERIGPRRWTAVAVGFLGVMLIIRPGAGVFDPISLLALAGAFGWATYQVLLRAVARIDQPDTTTLYTAGIGVICFTIAAPFFWKSPSLETWGWLAAVGILGSVGHFLLPAAFKFAPASTLQPFAYTMPVWAVFLGWAVFNHIPDFWTLAGGSIVICSGLFALWRERKVGVRR